MAVGKAFVYDSGYLQEEKKNYSIAFFYHFDALTINHNTLNHVILIAKSTLRLFLKILAVRKYKLEECGKQKSCYAFLNNKNNNKQIIVIGLAILHLTLICAIISYAAKGVTCNDLCTLQNINKLIFRVQLSNFMGLLY